MGIFTVSCGEISTDFNINLNSNNKKKIFNYCNFNNNYKNSELFKFSDNGYDTTDMNLYDKVCQALQDLKKTAGNKDIIDDADFESATKLQDDCGKFWHCDDNSSGALNYQDYKYGFSFTIDSAPEISAANKPLSKNLNNKNAYVQETEKFINAQYVMGMIKTKLPDLKAKYPQKANEIQQAFNNTQYSIGSDGVVTFDFKGPVNVETFKLIFIKNDGLFRNYLTDRHNKDVENENTTIAYIQERDGSIVKANDLRAFRDSNGVIQNDSSAKLINYWINNSGSTLIYSDGFGEKNEKTWYGKSYTQKDYTGMNFEVWDKPQKIHYSELQNP